MAANQKDSSPPLPTSEAPSQEAENVQRGAQPVVQHRKLSKDDFIFEKIIGEGSYSTVFQVTDKTSKRQYALKVLDKKQIVREKKVPYVSTEKDILAQLDHPLFVRLYFTFQDTDNLYFVLSLAKGGEILDYLRKVGSFDERATIFYSAEIIIALEYLHGKGIIHRDLKPENILLGEDMHILITDFGTAKVIKDDDRARSFVGTAEYVSPELLKSKVAFKSSDLWALGCITYQFLAGRPPFHASTEYLCFQKIIHLEYEIPEGFPENARDLVTKLLVSDHTQRLGCDEMGGYKALKSHVFYKDVNWEELHKENPPKLLPYLPAISKEDTPHHSNYFVTSFGEESGFQDMLLVQFGLGDGDSAQKKSSSSDSGERDRLLAEQAKTSPWHNLVNGELIVKSGLVDKRKGLFSKRRQMILTDVPRLYYVDPLDMTLKGEIPWSTSMKVEVKSWKIFFVHTPHRTYYLEDPSGHAKEWAETLVKWGAKSDSAV